ncbi:MAG: hypothetical protein WC294_05290 [Methanoregula sp.]
MSDQNQSQLTFAFFPALIILTALVILAGCSAPPGKNTTPEVPSTCSAETGVCPFIPLSVMINATPHTYSPLMSSTPGIRLTPNVSGFNPAEAEFAWNASYGQFLSWGVPDYTVRSLPQPVINHGETIYWSYSEPVASTLDPVIISVTARNISSGQIWGSSNVTLSWEGNFTVIVEKGG